MRNFLKAPQFKTKLILFSILFLAGIFRLYNINWDGGYHLHPDERMLIMVTEKIKWPGNFSEIFSPQSTLNPKFFPYGSFPIYFLRVISNLVGKVSGNLQYTNYFSINLVGRVLSALFDLGTCFLLFKMGKKVFSLTVGLLAASFYAFAVFPIQLSHFFAVDTFLNFFVTFTLYRLLIFYEKPVLKNLLIAGVVFGFALATKVSATVLLVAFGAAATADLALILGKRLRLFIKHKKIFYSSKTKMVILKEKLITLGKYSLKMTGFFSLSLITAFLVFVLLEPYAIIDFPTFLRQTKEQQAMTQNAFVFPYTLQYVGTTPFVYQLKNMVLWGTGLPLGIVSVIAIVFVIGYLIKEFPKPGNENQEAKMLILFSFLIAYFLVVGNFAVKFMRYLLPLYPIFFLFSAWFLIKVFKKIYWLKNVLILVVLLPTIFWSLAFLSIYSKPTTRVVATEWINQNIPTNSVIAREHWDDGLPLFGGEKFQYLEMPMYENDQSLQKWDIVNNNLKTADYIILASNRLYVPLQKLSDCQKYKVCYPKTANYYQDLFSGKLGFKKVAGFSSYPSFPLISQFLNISISIPDDSADESFTVYDHPRIIIFKKNAKFQKKQF